MLKQPLEVWMCQQGWKPDVTDLWRQINSLEQIYGMVADDKQLCFFSHKTERKKVLVGNCCDSNVEKKSFISV